MSELSLDAAEAWTPLAGEPARLFTYNGRIPGPTLEASPGDTVRIHLRNSLAEDTNLHFHGLHVPPGGAADNVFLHIPPAESFQYEFTIPDDHPSGTFWMHPHLHGSTARQVSRGLAAPLIVRGDLDRIPAVTAAREYILMLQDFDLTEGEVIEPSPAERIQGRQGPLVTAQGQANPVLEAAPGGWVRLRLINASSSRFYRLRIERHTLTQIATGGGGLPAPLDIDELLLAAGDRAEVMVRASREPGEFTVWSLPYNRSGMGMGMGMGGGMAGQPGAGQPEPLATLRCSGEPAPGIDLPSRLVGVEALTGPARVRTFTLAQGMGGMGMFGQPSFTINGRSFSSSRIDTRVRLGDVEDWEFRNATMMDHPMHIHTNPFQLVDARGAAEPAWRDIVTVPPGGVARVRTRFARFTGKLVYHCHILDHEDLGMMGVLEIQPA